MPAALRAFYRGDVNKQDIPLALGISFRKPTAGSATTSDGRPLMDIQQRVRAGGARPCKSVILHEPVLNRLEIAQIKDGIRLLLPGRGDGRRPEGSLYASGR
jgi:hypothetical protein